MTEITCKCEICQGRKALVPDALAALTKTKAGRHGLVHLAHDPNAVTGAAARKRTGVQAI
jgi:hypothetical protein